MSDSLLKEANDIYQNAKQIYTAAEVDQSIAAMAEKLTADFSEKNPVILAVMHGGVVVVGKIITQLKFPLQLDYIHVTRYGLNLEGQASIAWEAVPDTSLEDRNVIIVDDILDEGRTLQALKEHCQNAGAESIATAVLVEKQHDRKVADIKADYVGLTVDDHFVFGSGMDYKSYWRNAAGIYKAE